MDVNVHGKFINLMVHRKLQEGLLRVHGSIEGLIYDEGHPDPCDDPEGPHPLLKHIIGRWGGGGYHCRGGGAGNAERRTVYLFNVAAIHT